jgi:hypothetical protein
MPTLLRLAPHFGGQAFGPLGPHIALGSDPQSCHVALPASLGVAPIHCWLYELGPGQWTLQPASMGLGLYLLRPGQPPALVQSSATLRPGDAFALPHAQGPSFVVEVTTGAGTGPEQRNPLMGGGRGGRGLPTADAMGAELRRQLDTTLQTIGPLAEARQLFYRAQSGALSHPRVVVGALIGIFGFLCTGCGGAFGFFLR